MNEDSGQQQERPPPRQSKRSKIAKTKIGLAFMNIFKPPNQHALPAEAPSSSSNHPATPQMSVVSPDSGAANEDALPVQVPPVSSQPPFQVACTDPGVNQSLQEEIPALRRSARLQNRHLSTSDQIPSTSQVTATNNNRGATSQTTQPAQDLQITGILDERVLHKFHDYVAKSRKTTRVPIDERLQAWGNVPLGQLLEIDYQEPVSFDGRGIPYNSLMWMMLSEDSTSTRDHGSKLRDELFGSRRPQIIIRKRKDLPEALKALAQRSLPPVAIECDIDANLLQRHSPFSPPIEETKSFSANLLYLAGKEFKKDEDIVRTLKLLEDEDTTEPGTVSSKQKQRRVGELAGSAVEGSVTSSKKVLSKLSSAAGVVEADVSYTMVWRSTPRFEVFTESSSKYHGVLMVVEVKTLRINAEVEVTDERSTARSQYKKGLSQVIEYLHHAWEKFGTRSGLFVCGPFFARLAVIDDQGNIAVECKLPASVGSEYYNSQENNHDSPDSFFRVFDLQTLPHSLLVPYSSDPELARNLADSEICPLLNLDSLRRFEDTIRHTHQSALQMTVAQALGQRPGFPFANQIQYDDSPMPSAEDVRAGNSARIDKAGARSPILWYLSARRDAKERVSDKDVVKFLKAFDAHVNMEDVGIESHGEGSGHNGGGRSAKEGDREDRHEKKSKGGKGGVSGGNDTGRDGNRSQGRSADKHQEGGDNVRKSDVETLSDKVNAWASHSANPECVPPASPSLPPSPSPFVPDCEDKLDDALAMEEDWYEESGVLPPSSFAVKAASVAFMDTFFCYYPLTQNRRESL
ncbi:hypothetical protein IAR50_006994 [Cryptococcus sp. DSM 104548]